MPLEPPFSVVTETLPPCWKAKLPLTEAKPSMESVSEPLTWSSWPVNARSTVGALVPAAVGIESLPAASCVKSTAGPVDAELTCTWTVPFSVMPGTPTSAAAPLALSA